MNVVKRSEYCNGVSVEVEDCFVTLTSIPKGTVFSAGIGGGSHYKHVWVKTSDNAICIGRPGPAVGIGSVPYTSNGRVYGYEVLNATLVIEGE